MGVRGQIPLCSDVQENCIFYTFFGQLCLPALAQSHGKLHIDRDRHEGMGLLLCKPWKWSSHAVCLCALPGLLPRPNVYSLTAHSYQASAFEVTAHSANMLMAADYIKVRQSRQECRLSLTHIGTVFNMAFHLLLNQAKHSLRKQTNHLDFWGLKHSNKSCCMCTFQSTDAHTNKHRKTNGCRSWAWWEIDWSPPSGAHIYISDLSDT